MKVWVDQTECMGSGLCSMTEPRVFVLGKDGLAYVRDANGQRPEGVEGAIEVAEDCRATVLAASKSCVGACIYLEET